MPGLPLKQLPSAQQPINQTFPIGQQGTIEYKPNWGQPIVDGQWRGAPVSPTNIQRAPAGGIDPYAIFNRNKNELKEYYKQKAKTLKGYNLSPEAHNKAMAQIQEESNEVRLKFTSTRLQLDDIKRGVASGQIDPANGQQAMMQLVSPQGTVEAMFPKPEKQPTVGATGVSPAGMASYAKRFETLREGMIKKVDPKWWRWDTKQASGKEMIKRYFTERNIANLNNPKNAAKIPGFNQAFIESMGKDERTAELITELLDPKTGDPRMLAAFSPDFPLNRGFINQFGVTKGVSPFARTFKPKPKVSLGTKIAIGATGLSPLGGMATRRWMSKKRKAITGGLPSVSTDADYDKLPNGAQFIDPDGNVRTKP